MHYNNRCSRISGKASGVFHGWVSASARSRAMAAQGRREARRRLRGRRRPAAAHSGSRRSIRGRAAPQGPPATHPRGGELPEGPGEAHLLPARRPTHSWRRGASPAPSTARRPSNGASPCPRRRDSTSPGTGRSSHARRHPSTERRAKHCMHLSFYLTNCRTVFLLQELNVEMRKS